MKRQVWIDCDGVLADFDRGVSNVFGADPNTIEEALGGRDFWNTLRRLSGFYRDLPLMPDARYMMGALQLAGLRPIILTGCPYGGWAERQKIEWAAEHFPGVPMVCCMSKSKRDYCRRGDILVDDRDHYADRWREAGGVFIHHRSVMKSMRELEAELDWQLPDRAAVFGETGGV